MAVGLVTFSHSMVKTNGEELLMGWISKHLQMYFLACIS